MQTDNPIRSYMLMCSAPRVPKPQTLFRVWPFTLHDVLIPDFAAHLTTAVNWITEELVAEGCRPDLFFWDVIQDRGPQL